MRAEQRGSLSNLNYMNISMGDMGDTNTNSMGDHVPLRTTSFLSCALSESVVLNKYLMKASSGEGAERVCE